MPARFRGSAVSINLKSKALELRVRVEDALHSGDLMLVADEAHFLWPVGRLRHCVPGRVNWINTALANFDVPVALIITPQFYVAQKAVERKR